MPDRLILDELRAPSPLPETVEHLPKSIDDSLLLQAEWRIMANRFVDTAVFYDAGKMAARFADLDLNDLQHDYGFGVRFHGPISTPLRIEVAKSHEGLRLVFATSPIF